VNRSIWRSKGRREARPFLMLPTDMLHHPRFAGLSAHSVKLLLDVARQYNGKNNGDLAAPYSVLQRERHWKSRDTLGKSIGELCRAGFLEVTRRGRNFATGGTPEPNLYALTWKPIDPSPKHNKASATASRRWATVQNPSSAIVSEQTRKVA